MADFRITYLFKLLILYKGIISYGKQYLFYGFIFDYVVNNIYNNLNYVLLKIL